MTILLVENFPLETWHNLLHVHPYVEKPLDKVHHSLAEVTHCFIISYRICTCRWSCCWSCFWWNINVFVVVLDSAIYLTVLFHSLYFPIWKHFVPFFVVLDTSWKVIVQCLCHPSTDPNSWRQSSQAVLERLVCYDPLSMTFKAYFRVSTLRI